MNHFDNNNNFGKNPCFSEGVRWVPLLTCRWKPHNYHIWPTSCYWALGIVAGGVFMNALAHYTTSVNIAYGICLSNMLDNFLGNFTRVLRLTSSKVVQFITLSSHVNQSKLYIWPLARSAVQVSLPLITLVTRLQQIKPTP